MAQIRADEITRVLRDEIENYDSAVSVTETGFVISVGDGIARIHGLETVMAGELIEFLAVGGVQAVDQQHPEQRAGHAPEGQPLRDREVDRAFAQVPPAAQRLGHGAVGEGHGQAVRMADEIRRRTP